MKKYLSFLIVFLIVMAFISMPANAALRHFTLTVYKATATAQLNDPLLCEKLTSNVIYAVYASGTTSPVNPETIYSNTSGTTIVSNPWVLTGVFEQTDNIDFYCDPSVSDDKTVWVLVIDSATACSAWIQVTYDKNHYVIIDERHGVQQMLTLPASDSVLDPSGVTKAATSTWLRIYFAPGTLIQDVFLDVTGVAATGGSIDLGSGASGTAYVSGLSTATAGFVQDDVFDTAFQYITGDPASNYQKLYFTWHVDSFDGFINILKTIM